MNARELHAFLEVGKVYRAWITERIDQYNFNEGIDFITLLKNEYSPPTKEYHLTLDMAKALSMVERTDKGKQAVSDNCNGVAKRYSLQGEVCVGGNYLGS